MAEDNFRLYNARLYSDSTVAIGYAVTVSNGVIQEIIPEGKLAIAPADRNLEGAILSPGLFDLCCRINDKSSQIEQISQIRQLCLASATTDVALIMSPRTALSLLLDSGLATLNRQSGAHVVGIRLDCREEVEFDLVDIKELLARFPQSIIDVRCDSTDKGVTSLASVVQQFGGRLCLELPDSQDELGLPIELSNIPISCISVSFNSLQAIPEHAGFVEIRTPGCGELDLRPSAPKGSTLYERTLIGNHRLLRSAPPEELAQRLRREMYFLTQSEFELMPSNLASLYLNRYLGVPMNRTLRIASYNAALYVGREHQLGQVKPGYLAHFSILDRKLGALAAIV